MLGNLPHEEWSETRKVLSRAFTPAKLKEMVPQIKDKVDIFMKKVVEGEMDFYPLLQGLTLDIIGQTGFGVECHIQENINDPLHLAVQAEFAKSPSSWLVKVGIVINDEVNGHITIFSSFFVQGYLCFSEFTWLLQPFRVALYKLQEHLGWAESSELWDTGFSTFHKRTVENRCV